MKKLMELFLAKKDNYFLIFLYSGLGDLLLTTPCFKALKKKYKKDIRVICPAYQIPLLENNPFIYDCYNEKYQQYLSLFNKVFYKKFDVKETKYSRFCPSTTFKEKHATDIIAEMLDVEIEDKKILLYLTEAEVTLAKKTLSSYKNPIILNITSNCSVNQMWSKQNWEKLVSDMKEFTFLQLGVSSETRIVGTIDFLGKTSLRESAALVGASSLFVGVDSFLAHVTNAFDTKGVVLFGDSTPVVWGHQNNINIYKKLHCSPCVDLLQGQTCPYNSKCMRDITVNEVKQAILVQAENTRENNEGSLNHEREARNFKENKTRREDVVIA